MVLQVIYIIVLAQPKDIASWDSGIFGYFCTYKILCLYGLTHFHVNRDFVIFKRYIGTLTFLGMFGHRKFFACMDFVILGYVGLCHFKVYWYLNFLGMFGLRNFFACMDFVILGYVG